MDQSTIIHTLSDLGEICSGMDIKWTNEYMIACRRASELIAKKDNKEEVIDILEKMLAKIDELEDPKYLTETHELPLEADGSRMSLEKYALVCYCRGWEEARDIIESQINALKEH